jgi:hypothetical protein
VTNVRMFALCGFFFISAVCALLSLRYAVRLEQTQAWVFLEMSYANLIPFLVLVSGDLLGEKKPNRH